MAGPGELTLRARPAAAVWPGLACLAFVAVGAWMIGDGEPMGWLVAGVFGLGAAILLASALPGANFLRLTDEGFEARTLFRTWRFRWADVAGFGVGAAGGQVLVMFDLAPAYLERHPSRLVPVSRALSGFDAGLPQTYGLKAEALAALMESWRRAAVEES